MAGKLIVVEPDKDQREEFLAAIKGSEFEVTEFYDTNAEVVQNCDTTRANVVVLRLVSGKEGAVAALDKLHKVNPNAKVVASYNVGSTHLLMAAYSHGAVAAIKQPFHLHRVVERLTFAVASEQHAKLGGPIVRLEHPVQVRYKGRGLFARSRVGFCERLGLGDMDLNVERELRVKSELKLELMLPPPAGTVKLDAIVQEVETTRPDNWCCYLSFKNATPEFRKAVEAFVVKAAA